MQGFVESEAVNTTRSLRRCGDLFANPEGLTLHRRKEHGNTFAPEIEFSTGCDGIPLKGEEIIGRYGQKKTAICRR
jgi:hypothetical protein